MDNPDLPHIPLERLAGADPVSIFKRLAEFDVEYLIVGAVAVAAHGHVRATTDTDIIPNPTAENIDRLVRALNALGALLYASWDPSDRHKDKIFEGEPVTAERLIAAVNTILSTEFGQLDVLTALTGAAPYAELETRASRFELDGVSLTVVSLDDLISMKQTAGRPRDMDDIAELTRSERPTDE